MRHQSTKLIPLGSTTFRQWRADSHCRFLHGYRLQAKIWFEADELDSNHWVYDFGGCKEIKKLLEGQFDHTTCIAGDDPELDTFKQLEQAGIIQLRVMEDGVGIEKTAQWVYEQASQIVGLNTQGRVSISKVEVWEHEGNSATFQP